MPVRYVEISSAMDKLLMIRDLNTVMLQVKSVFYMYLILRKYITSFISCVMNNIEHANTDECKLQCSCEEG